MPIDKFLDNKDLKHILSLNTAILRGNSGLESFFKKKGIFVYAGSKDILSEYGSNLFYGLNSLKELVKCFSHRVNTKATGFIIAKNNPEFNLDNLAEILSQHEKMVLYDRNDLKAYLHGVFIQGGDIFCTIRGEYHYASIPDLFKKGEFEFNLKIIEEEDIFWVIIQLNRSNNFSVAFHIIGVILNALAVGQIEKISISNFQDKKYRHEIFIDFIKIIGNNRQIIGVIKGDTNKDELSELTGDEYSDKKTAQNMKFEIISIKTLIDGVEKEDLTLEKIQFIIEESKNYIFYELEYDDNSFYLTITDVRHYEGNVITHKNLKDEGEQISDSDENTQDFMQNWLKCAKLLRTKINQI